MKKILLSIFFSFVIALSFVSSTFAASDYDNAYRITDDLRLGRENDCGGISTTRHITIDDIRDYVSSLKPVWLSSFDTAVINKTVVITQDFQPAYNNYSVDVFFTDDPNINATYNFSNTTLQATTLDVSGSTMHYLYLGVYGSDCSVHQQSWDDTRMVVSNDFPGSTSSAYFNYIGGSFPVNYPDSYAGLPIREALAPPVVYPAIYNSSFIATYNGLSVDFTATATPGGQPTDVKITHFMWKFEGENDTFTDVTDIEQHAVGDSGYFYSSESHHDYNSTGDYNVYLTVVDENNESKTFHQSIKVIAAGQGTFYGNAETDISTSDIACDQSDFMSRLICTTKKQFNIGLINPSINAVKNIFSALVVSDSPTCGFTLMDLTIVSGEVFPLSQLSTVVCTRVDQIRNAFPVVSVLINFALAYLLLRLIITIINRLLDHTKTDIIEGIK